MDAFILQGRKEVDQVAYIKEFLANGTFKHSALLLAHVSNKLRMMLRNGECSMFELRVFQYLLKNDEAEACGECLRSFGGFEILCDVFSLHPEQYTESINFVLDLLLDLARLGKEAKLDMYKAGVISSLVQLCRRTQVSSTVELVVCVLAELVVHQNDFFLTDFSAPVTPKSARMSTMSADSVSSALVHLLSSSRPQVKRAGVRLGLAIWLSEAAVISVLHEDDGKWFNKAYPHLCRILFSKQEAIEAKYEAADWTIRLCQCRELDGMISDMLCRFLSSLFVLPLSYEGESIVKSAKWELKSVYVQGMAETAQTGHGGRAGLVPKALRRRMTEAEIEAKDAINGNPMIISCHVMRLALDEAVHIGAITIPTSRCPPLFQPPVSSPASPWRHSTLRSGRNDANHPSSVSGLSPRTNYSHKSRILSSESFENRSVYETTFAGDNPEEDLSGWTASQHERMSESVPVQVTPVVIPQPQKLSSYLMPFREAGTHQCMLLVLLTYSQTFPFYAMTDDPRHPSFNGAESDSSTHPAGGREQTTAEAKVLAMHEQEESESPHLKQETLMLAFTVLGILQDWVNMDAEVDWLVRKMFLEEGCLVVDRPSTQTIDVNDTIKALYIPAAGAESVRPTQHSNHHHHGHRNASHHSAVVGSQLLASIILKMRQIIKIGERAKLVKTPLNDSLMTESRDISVSSDSAAPSHHPPHLKAKLDSRCLVLASMCSLHNLRGIHGIGPQPLFRPKPFSSFALTSTSSQQQRLVDSAGGEQPQNMLDVTENDEDARSRRQRRRGKKKSARQEVKKDYKEYMELIIKASEMTGGGGGGDVNPGPLYDALVEKIRQNLRQVQLGKLLADRAGGKMDRSTRRHGHTERAHTKLKMEIVSNTRAFTIFQGKDVVEDKPSSLSGHRGTVDEGYSDGPVLIHGPHHAAQANGTRRPAIRLAQKMKQSQNVLSPAHGKLATPIHHHTSLSVSGPHQSPSKHHSQSHSHSHSHSHSLSSSSQSPPRVTESTSHNPHYHRESPVRFSDFSLRVPQGGSCSDGSSTSPPGRTSHEAHIRKHHHDVLISGPRVHQHPTVRTSDSEAININKRNVSFAPYFPNSPHPGQAQVIVTSPISPSPPLATNPNPVAHSSPRTHRIVEGKVGQLKQQSADSVAMTDSSTPNASLSSSTVLEALAGPQSHLLFR